MLRFSHSPCPHSPRLFRYIGLALLLAQFFLFVFGLPPFKTGIWTQTEPVMAALFAFAALNAFWLGTGLLRKWLELQPSPPLWRCLLAFVAWQALATAMASSPWHSWFGPPQLGEGAGWWLSLLLLTGILLPLWQEEKTRRILLAGAVASVTVQALLCLLYPASSSNTSYVNSWAPAPWTSYLGFVAGYIWVALVAAGVVVTRGRFLLLLAGTALLLLVSHNKSSWVLLGPALLASAFLPRLQDTFPFLRLRLWKYAAMAGCLLPALWIAYSAAMPLPVIDPVDPNAPYDRCGGALTSRIILNRIAISTMSHEPERWLMGDGWGGFADSAFKYMMVKDVHAFRDGMHQPNCFMIDGISLHSHSQPLEVLMALGLPGLCLWFALQMMLVYCLPERLFWRCAPACVALTALNFLWFQLPQGIAFHALFLAALLAACPPRPPRPGRISAASAGAICLYLGLAAAASAWQQWRATAYGEFLNYALLEPPSPQMEQWLPQDFSAGGERWQSHALFFTLIAAEKERQDKSGPGDADWMSLFLDSAREAAQSPRMGASVSSAELWLYYELATRFKDARYDELRQKIAPHMEDAILSITRKAPLREDYTALYLVQVNTYYKSADKRAEFLEKMLSIAPNHRGALWVLGHLLLATPGREDEGIALLRKAARLGVQDVFPVTDKDLKPFLAKE